MSNLVRLDLFIVLLLSFIFFLFLKKFKIFYYQKNNETHKNFVSNSKGVSFLLGFILVLNYAFANNIYKIENLFILLIFFIGLFSDLKILDSPKLRLIIQSIIILIFFYYMDLYVSDIRIDFINKLLSNNFLAILFTTFCLAILLNGVNFIDGLNCNVLFYFLGVSFILFLVSLDLNSKELITNYSSLIYILIFLIILNFKGKNYLGDNGSYSLAFIIGILIIKDFNLKPNLSPYFFAVLLWYPAYENLFSIIRKISNGKKPFEPDTQHFHQILYSYIIFKVKKNKKYKFNCNTLTSILINIFNYIIFLIAYQNSNQTQFLISVIIFAVILKTLIYFYLKKKLITFRGI